MSRISKQEKFGKAKYKAGFLGSLYCSWLCGVKITDQALRELVYGDQKNVVGELPRFSITVDKRELKITQTVVGKGGKKKIPLNGILMRDLLFAAQGSTKDLEGMVGCIYYSYTSTTNGWPLTVHGYLFDSAKSANRFVRHLKQYIESPEHRELILIRERELVDRGWLIPVSPPGLQGTQPFRDDGVEVRRGLRRTPVADVNPIQISGEGVTTSTVVFQQTETNPLPTGPTTKGPHRLPRMSLQPDPSDESLLHHNNQVRQSQDLTRTPSNASHLQLSSFQPLDDDESIRKGSRSSIFIVSNCTSARGSLRDFSQTVVTDSDHRVSVQWGRDGSSVAVNAPMPRVASCIAAELKSRLSQGAVLLPPKDYDTISRTRGNIAGIEARKFLYPADNP